MASSPNEALPSFSRVVRSSGRLTSSARLAKLNINLAWLTSALRSWTISRRTRTDKETRSQCLRQPSGSSARSDVGKPRAYDGGSCKISSWVAVSTAAMLGRLFTRFSIPKEFCKLKRVVAWSQLRGSAGSHDFHIRPKGQFKRTKQAFRK
jgi:hypothetical protein